MLSLPILDLLQDSCDPPLTPQAIAEIEIALGKRFPKDYADFLLQFNGGEFYRNVEFYIPHPTEFVTAALLQDFFGEPNDGIDHTGLVSRADTFSDRLPDDFLAIAHCNSTDLLVLKL